MVASAHSARCLVVSLAWPRLERGIYAAAMIVFPNLFRMRSISADSVAAAAAVAVPLLAAQPTGHTAAAHVSRGQVEGPFVMMPALTPRLSTAPDRGTSPMGH